MTSQETRVQIEAVRVPHLRDSVGVLNSLADSILNEGMHNPITLWKDGTLISGARRLRANLLLGRTYTQAVFVDTIEDAAKNLLRDNEDDEQALPWKWSEVCRLWEVLRRLDEPAAAKRADEARRRGVELRRLTQAGKRKPGRSANTSEDYVLSVLSGPFGVSERTAKRLWLIYHTAHLFGEDAAEKRDAARQALDDIDAGLSSISANYARLVGGRSAPVSRPRPVAPIESAAARVQLTAWDKSLPQLEGLVAGLVELGPPNADLTWDQVGPVHTRLMVVRRELEKMIKKMRESNES